MSRPNVRVVQEDKEEIVVEASASVSYGAQAPRGAVATDAVWRCYKIEQSNVGAYPNTTTIRWAAGYQAPGAAGANLAGMTYV